MNNQEFAAKILEVLGGTSNIVTGTNCMTRLRLTIKDMSKVDLATLKAIPGVMGVVEDGNLQIIVGPGKAQKVTDIMSELGMNTGAPVTGNGVEEDWKTNKEAIKSGQKHSPVKDFLKLISNIFVPLIPAIIAAGLLTGAVSILDQLKVQGVLEIAAGGKQEIVYTMLKLMGHAFLGYFAIFTGVNAAKQFGANEALGGMIGAISISPAIITISTAIGLYNVKTPLDSVLTTGKGGIIGVIFGVWVLSKVEKGLRKIVPDVLDLILVPMLSIVITGTILVFVLMPAAGYASDLLVNGLNEIILSSNEVVRVISGFVLSALFLPMVLFGLHHGLIPIYAVQLQATGAVTLFPVLAMAGAGQVGASAAVYIKAKRLGNKRLTNVIAGALPAGILGVGEPLIYGVTLPLGTPFITAGLGAGFGGAFIMLSGVASSAWGPSGLVAVPMMIGGKAMMNFVIGLIISYVGGFIITMLSLKDEAVKNV